MKSRNLILPFLATAIILTQTALAQSAPSASELERLRPSQSQVEAIFGLFLSQLPAVLGDSKDRDLVTELAPQALELLTGEQRQALEKLAASQQVERVQSMTESERARYLLDAARSLTHPSKAEWLRRIEEFSVPSGE